MIVTLVRGLAAVAPSAYSPSRPLTRHLPSRNRSMTSTPKRKARVRWRFTRAAPVHLGRRVPKRLESFIPG